MDPHGWRGTFYSSLESQVCGGGKSDNVVAKEDMIATTTVIAPYLEVKKDAIECFF